jgi:hypothetical protein
MAHNLSKLCFLDNITTFRKLACVSAEIYNKIILFCVESAHNYLTNPTYDYMEVMKLHESHTIVQTILNVGGVFIVLVDHFSRCGNVDNHIQVQHLDMESSDDCAIINHFWKRK